MKKVFKTMAFTLLGLVLSSNLWAADPVVLFHETFGDNSGSARDWNNTYSVKSGVAEVYSGVSYTTTNVKQGKNTTGQTKSGLSQSTSNTDAIFEFGPLDVSDYKTLNLSYYWKAASIKGTYTTKISYKTSKSGSYSEITPSATGATTFVQVSKDLPSAVDKCGTLYLKIVFNTSNTQATIDEVELTGVFDGATPTEPSLSVSPTTIDFGTVYQNATVDAEDVTVTFANLTTNDVAAAISGSAFSIDKTGSFTSGDKITITPSTATLDEYEETLTLSATGVDDQTVTIKMNVVEAPAPTGIFNKFTGDNLKEGDYVLVYGNNAVSNVLSSKKLQSGTYTLTDNAIKNPDESIIWHIAANETHWTIYSEAAEKYAGGSTSKNDATLLDEVTNYALWDVTIDNQKNTYDFANVGRAGGTSDTGNKWLHCNTGSNNVWAPYTSSTGGALTLYKKYVELAKSAVTFASCENGSVGATVNSTAISSGAIVDEDAVVTLTNTPADGYKLDAYDVYKTGESSTKVTVTDGKFKMPAYAVTVSATFSLSIETPVLSEEAGDKDDAINVKVTNYNGDYSYYYTLDGIDPTNASTPYVDADGIAINASCTLKVIAYKGEVTSSVASAAYNLPLMTMDAIFAKATAVGSTATAVRVKFTNCVVTGVKNNNAYLTDNDGKGLIIFQSSHGFEVNDKLNGAVNVKVQLYNGSAEITTLTSSTSGLTVTKDGSVSPITTIGIASLSGVNTGAVLSYTNLIYDNGYFSDGENTIQPYNTFKIADYPDFADGDKYNVTGVYIQYNTKEIAPRSLDDLEKIEATKYAINLATVEHGTIATDPETEAADGVKVTLSATPETGYMLSAWSVVDAESNPVEVINNQFTMPAKEVTVSATFVELPIWATTYTSNVTVGTDKVRFSEEGEQYDAKKTGSSSSTGSTTITIPAGTYAIHFHAAGWNSENVTLAVKNGTTALGSFNIPKDAGMNNNSPFTLENDPAATEYFMVALSNITEETTITFEATSGKRFAIYGVNALAPAAITIDPASKDFGEVKQGFNAEQVFTLTPNAFATGTITAEIDGDNVFTASGVEDNKVTVTFAPTEITDYSATLVIKHDGTQMCTAALTGKGISAATPTIDVDKENIDFGTKKQGESFESQTVAVTLNYLSAATVAVTGNFEVTPTSLTESGIVTVSVKSTTDADTFDGELTISGDGASDKVISLHAVVADKWATTYSSNISDINENLSYGVIVENVTYEKSSIKIGASGKGGEAKLKIPEGTKKLHFHVAAWKDKSTGLTVKMGEIELRNIESTYIPSEDGVSGNGTTYTLAGNTSTDQYFNIDLSGYTIEENTEITFTTSSERVVLYGVNQEGGVTTVLQSIEIQGTATALNYEIGQTFVPTGLKVVGTFKKGDAEPTTRDLTNAEFDWSFNPAQFNEENESASVIVTATAKENTEVTANKTIENIVVIAPVVEITTTTTKVDFGTVAQNATVDNELVYVTFKNCTSASVALSGDDAEKFMIDAETVEAGDYNYVIVGVKDGTTDVADTYTATLTIHADGAKADIELPVTLFVEAPESCDNSDDFETVEAVSGYGARTTTAGWTATNTRVDVVDGYTYFTMNGKTTAAGVITSPELEGGIASLKLRYGHLVANESKGVSFRVDIKQDEEVVYTKTITKANEDVVRNEVYSETISDINVVGTYQIVITNLCPTQKSDGNADRVAIGRLCITEYADYARSELTIGNYGTICLPNAVEEVTGAVFYNIVGYQGEISNPSGIVIESVVDELVAGMPYIFKATASQITVTYKGDAVTAPVTDATSDAANGLIGSFVEKTLVNKDESDIYGIKNNALRKLTTEGEGNQVGANRAYIDMSQMSKYNPNIPAAPGAHRVAMSNSSYSAPTNFNGLNGNAKAQKVMKRGRFYIIREAKMYNAQGIEVQ